MLFLRLVGSALLILSSFLGANVLNKKAEKEFFEAEAFSRLVRMIKLEVEAFMLPIPKILLKIDRELLRSCGYKGEGEPKDLFEFISNSEVKNAECRALFFRFASDFGTGYREEELRKLGYYVELFESEAERLREGLPAKKKLNSTLCISSALGMVILMI